MSLLLFACADANDVAVCEADDDCVHAANGEPFDGEVTIEVRLFDYEEPPPIARRLS